MFITNRSLKTPGLYVSKPTWGLDNMYKAFTQVHNPYIHSP